MASFPGFSARALQRVVEVGSNWGPVAERLAPREIVTFCVESDPDIVRSAHRPSVRATAARLPFANGSVDAVTALNVLHFLDNPEEGVAEAHRILRENGIFVACTQMRDNDPEFKDVIPGWGEPQTFEGENAEAVVGTAFDDVEVEP